jgi:hypothetical protein
MVLAREEDDGRGGTAALDGSWGLAALSDCPLSVPTQFTPNVGALEPRVER